MALTAQSGNLEEGRPFSRPGLTDAYVLQCLIQQTNDPRAPLVWRENGQGACEALANGVRLELDLLHARGGSRLLLTLRDREDCTKIVEPVSTAVFGRQYRTEEDREIAGFLRTLAQTARRQMAERQKSAEARRGLRKQSIYRRLVFGVGSE